MSLDPAANLTARLEPDDADSLRGAEFILLLEDNDLMRTLTARMLVRFGYRVTAVETAAEARKFIPEAALLLSDVVIGDEISGPQLAREARRSHAALRVLLTTGHTPEAPILQGICHAEFPILFKPYSMRGLLMAVRAALDAEIGHAPDGP